MGTQHQKKVYALFIDFERAFPSISHSKLWAKLHSIGIPSKILRVMQNIYHHSGTKIKLESGFSSTIAMTEGLLQGEIASPLLFSLFIYDIVDKLKASGISGIQITEEDMLHILMFADDMVTLAPSKRALQLKINVLQKYFVELGLKVNLGRPKLWCFEEEE